MKETYYIKQEGIVTINYAYMQNDVIMYPDLIKLKVALNAFYVKFVVENNYFCNLKFNHYGCIY